MRSEPKWYIQLQQKPNNDGDASKLWKDACRKAARKHAAKKYQEKVSVGFVDEVGVSRWMLYILTYAY